MNIDVALAERQAHAHTHLVKEMSSSAAGTDEALPRLLQDVHHGRIQVPEFQREVIKDDEWVRSLLASVSLRYPIGAVMLLRSGSPDLRFESRPVAGAPTPSTEPEWLLIDGQQRVTVLYQALASSQGVRTGDLRDPSIRWYYINLTTALDPNMDRDEAVVSVPETRHVHEFDARTVELEWEHGLFPLRLVFGDDTELQRWQHGFVRHGPGEATNNRGQMMARFDAEILQAFVSYRVPTILHGPETTRWSVRVHGGPVGRSLSERFRTHPG